MKSELPFEVKVSSRYGAPMGRREGLPADTTERLHLRKVPMFDGDYDKGGAYWGGGGTPLFCAWDSEGEALYVRASNRGAAKLAVLEYAPGARFFK